MLGIDQSTLGRTELKQYSHKLSSWIAGALFAVGFTTGACADPIAVDGGWYTFCIDGGPGNPAHASPCFVNQGVGLTGNTITFSSTGSTVLQVTDAFISGENFQVVIDGTSYITPSVVPWAVVNVFDPNEAFANPGYSKGSWVLSPGAHTVDIFSQFTNNTGPNGGGAAYVRAVSAVPDAPSFALIGAGLILVLTVARNSKGATTAS